jgi:hypothetical protein
LNSSRWEFREYGLNGSRWELREITLETPEYGIDF